MSEKRRTIRHELPGDDPELPQTQNDGISTELPMDEESKESLEDQRSTTGLPDYRASLIHELGDTNPTVNDDGRVEIDCDSKTARVLSVLYQRPKSDINQRLASEHDPSEPGDEPPGYDKSGRHNNHCPQLNVLIQVVGSRGDVQPFIALGNQIQKLGCRVRLATHDTFATFVRDSGLEFYPIGGDPAALMAYMVKNPGLIPSFQSLQAGEIQQKRYMVEEMLEGFWYSCIQPDPLTREPFVADAIIGNPPAFAHVHCAQALGVPVHIVFTVPWSSTSAFPHPLANLRNQGGDRSAANYASYAIVEYLTWQGLGDIINKWRTTIDLEEIAPFDGPLLAERLRIPFTYCWSPAIVPKLADWGAHIDVCGFFFRNAPLYSPPEDLALFLSAGTAPVYIVFGSIVLDDPECVIKVILDAVRIAGVRAIISKGWSNLAGLEDENVYWIGDCPHEWLFAHVAAVVHHGGAGTTARGLSNGVPTLIMPFFGDQPFWGDMVANAGVGPRPIPFRELTSQRLADGIAYCLTPEAKAAAGNIAHTMGQERGVEAAVESWLRQLPRRRLACDIIPSQPASWIYKNGKRPIKLSKIAAEQLVSRGLVNTKHLESYKTRSFNTDATRWDPVSGGASAVLSTAVDMGTSITGMVTKPIDEYKYEKRRQQRDLRRQASPRGMQQRLSESRLSESRLSESDDRPSTAQSQRSDASSVDEVGRRNPRSGAATIVGASAKSIGMLGPTAAKGMLVDIPLAIAEGLKAVPSHFGTSVRDHGQITGAKSGAAVAGKTIAWGFADGLSDLVMEPIRGANNEGALGAVKGVGKGAVSLVTKSGAGMFGLFAYPSAGIAKSLRNAVHKGTGKLVAQAKHLEGQWLLKRGLPPGVTGDDVASEFDRLRKTK